MTIPEAAQLVIQASALARGGELFLLDMGEPVLIKDLAEQMIKLAGLTIKSEKNPSGDIEIVVTGLRSGEKLYEELLIDAESQQTKHKLIYRAYEKSLSYENIVEKTKDLEKMIDRFDLDSSLKLLKTVVPEMKIKDNE